MTTSVLTNTSMPVHRFDVDPEIKDLEKKLKVRAHTQEVRKGLSSTKAAYALIAVLLTVGQFMTPLGSFQENLIRAVAISVGYFGFLTVGILAVREGDTDENIAANRERKSRQRSIKRSVRSARALRDVVPVVNLEHVEAGIRINKAIEGTGHVWVKRDAERLLALLLTDLNRERAITSLIEERGLVTTDQVIAALAEMEAVKNPIQNGWL